MEYAQEDARYWQCALRAVEIEETVKSVAESGNEETVDQPAAAAWVEDQVG